MATQTPLIDVGEPTTAPIKRQPPPPTLNLPSTNPFRNQSTSPVPPQSPLTANSIRGPRSRNPFLDANEPEDSLDSAKSRAMPPASQRNSTSVTTNEQLFNNLVLDEKEQRGYGAARPVAQGPGGPSRKPLPIHRPTRSQEWQEGLGAAGPAPVGGDPSGLNTDRRVQMRHPMSKPRPRRNSDTSIGEDERRRRDRRRPRDSKQPGQKDRPPQTKPSKRLDIIDKLDVTGIYGVGVFHHDGPFDALNPHRNRRLGSKAPMQAFPEGSANNALIGPTADPKAFHNQFLGHAGAGAYADYANGASSDYRVGEKDSRASSTRLTTFNPLSKAELVHGEETLGLGTSTFLDNTPASRAVLQSQEAELASGLNGGGMMRKKSIAQRIRGINRDRAYGFHPSGSMTSPEGPVYRTISETPQSPAEGDPFFNEYGKKEGVTVEEKEVGSEDGQRTEEGDRSRNRAISTPSAASNVRHGLNSSSADMGRDEPRVGSSNGGAPTGGGFLNRVKSLKGRRPR